MEDIRRAREEEVGSSQAVGSVIGPTFRERAGEVSSALSELQEIPSSFPFELELPDGTAVHIGEDMVNSARDSVVSGEYFTPRIIEPAFGIDRIIWHILDHNYKEVDKEGEKYTILSLNPAIARPI